MADETIKSEQIEEIPQSEETAAPEEASEQQQQAPSAVEEAVEESAPEEEAAETDPPQEEEQPVAKEEEQPSDDESEPEDEEKPEGEGDDEEVKEGEEGKPKNHNPNALDPDLPTPYGDEVVAVLEALLFATTQPVSIKKLSVLMNGVPEEEIEEALKTLHTRYLDSASGLILMEVANGWQVATRPEVADWILRLHKHRKRQALSPSLLETLAIVAYKQPLTRAEIEAIRGVDCGSAMRSIQDAGLVEVVGRKESLGRPPLYGTTELFLKTFGLKDIEQLPSLGDLKSILDVQMKAPPEEEEDELEETIEGEETNRENETSEAPVETTEEQTENESSQEETPETEKSSETSEEAVQSDASDQSDESVDDEVEEEEDDPEDLSRRNEAEPEADAPTHDNHIEADMNTEDAALDDEEDDEFEDDEEEFVDDEDEEEFDDEDDDDED